MKKNYEAPSLVITKFETEDVLHDSVIDGQGTPSYGGPVTGLGGKNDQINPT